MNLRKKYGLIAGICVLNLALQLAILYRYSPGSDDVIITKEDSDTFTYNGLAINLLQKGEYSNVPGDWAERYFLTSDSVRPPGYPVFIYIIYLLFGYNYMMIIYFQMFIALMNVLLVYLISSKLVEQKFAVIAMLFQAIEPNQLFMSFSFMNETFFIFFLLVFIFCVINYLLTNQISFLITSGIIISVMAFIKPISIFYTVFLIVLYILYSLRHRNQNEIKRSMIFTGIFVALISGWMFRNYMVYNSFSFSATSGFNLYFGYAGGVLKNNGIDYKIVDREYFDYAVKNGVSKDNNPFQNDKIYFELGLQKINESKANFIKDFFSGVINQFIFLNTDVYLIKLKLKSNTDYKEHHRNILTRIKSFSNEELINILFKTYFVLVNILIILGFLYSAMKYYNWKTAPVLFIFLTIIFFSIISGNKGNEDGRYKTLITPFMIICAGITSQKLIIKN